MNNLSITHYIPLIGPFILAQKKLQKENGLNFTLNGVYSFPGFKNNEQHIEFNDPSFVVNYFEDENLGELITQDSNLEPWKKLVEKYDIKKSNIVTGVPPCAGLSMLNSNNSCSDKVRGCDAIQNNWMFSALKFYLATDSDVMVIENAPGLATTGLPLVSKMRRILDDNSIDRKLQLIKTSAYHHGIPQNRHRTFLIVHKQKHFIRLKNKKHEYQSLEQFLETVQYKNNDPCFFNTKEYPELSEFLKFIKQHSEFIDEFKAMPSPKVKPLWKLILPHVEKNPHLLDGFEELTNTFKHIQRKKSMNKGFWDGSPTLVKGHVNAVISKNRLSIFNPLDNYQSLLKVRHFMHLMGIPIEFDLKDPTNTWKHITQNVPVNAAADAILWAIECLDSKSETIQYKDDFIIQDNSKGDIYNTIYNSHKSKINMSNEMHLFSKAS